MQHGAQRHLDPHAEVEHRRYLLRNTTCAIPASFTTFKDSRSMEDLLFGVHRLGEVGDDAAGW